MQPKPENDLVYLLLILESIGKIDIYSADFEDAFEFYQSNDQLHLNACLLLLSNIGEQIGKVSMDTKEVYSGIPWRQVKDFRNRIVHDYTGIDFEMVFDIIKNELPVLKLRLEEIIRHGLMKEIFRQEDYNIARGSTFYNHVDFDNME